MPKAAQTKSAKASKSTKAVKSSKQVKKTTPKKKTVSHKLLKNKPYLEFVTAFLSIPVLITVMLLNFNTLKNLNAKTAPTPTPGVSAQGGFYAEPVGSTKLTTPTPMGGTNCSNGLGPVSIDSPQEGDMVTDNPVTINIDYNDTGYCAAAWSYRINGGSWSGYDDRSVALYNLPQGPIKFELRVKSVSGDSTKTLTRNFTYNGSGTILIPTSQSSSNSAH